MKKETVLPLYEWFVRPADEGFCLSLASKLKISSLSARLLYHRGVRSAEEGTQFLGTSLAHIRSPFLFRTMEPAVQRVVEAILRKEKVLIYGDYDVDGLTGTAILIQFLRYAGLEPVYYIPDRLTEGYGFHPECVRRFHEKGVQLILTVDCGITSYEAVSLANHLGIDVIITDHHACSDRLPPARAILNPKAPEEEFPFRELAGVGVAFYLLVALRMRLREIGHWKSTPEPNLRSYLDLVALGTLADMVPLQQENRIFVKFGLEEISASHRPGVCVLKELCGIRGSVLKPRPLLYRMIPRINAPGRLGHPLQALDILLCEDPEEARCIAREMEDRNVRRRSVEEEVYKEAVALAEKLLRESDDTVLVLGAEKWHKGILGIVAARLVEKFHRPVVLLSFDGDAGKGSIRTTEDVDILDALFACRSVLEDYGGHRVAAGITLKKQNMDRFQEVFSRAVQKQLGEEERKPRPLLLDFWLTSPVELNDELVSEFDRLAPFGNGNGEPVVGLASVSILDRRIVGKNHLKLTFGDATRRFEAIGFGMGNESVMQSGQDRWDLAFTPEREDWKGRSQIRLRILDIRPSGATPPLSDRFDTGVGP